jgi:hypothetical protein
MTPDLISMGTDGLASLESSASLVSQMEGNEVHYVGLLAAAWVTPQAVDMDTVHPLVVDLVDAVLSALVASFHILLFGVVGVGNRSALFGW